MFTTRQFQIATYTRKVYAPYRLTETRLALTLDAASKNVKSHMRLVRPTKLVALDTYKFETQREEFALHHHAHDCPCQFCTYEREMREEAYELEYEVGLAAHYEATEVLEEDQCAREEASDEDFGLTEEDYNEFRERNVERGTASTHWY